MEIVKMMQMAVCAVMFAVASVAASARTLDVAAYGAKADGVTDNTAAIQKAIDECSAKGGGRVIVPGGGIYVTYTLNLKNNVELHIDRGATLMGGEDPLTVSSLSTRSSRYLQNRAANVKYAPKIFV